MYIEVSCREACGLNKPERGDVESLAARIADGASLALAPDYSGCALAVVRALIRRGARDLDLIGVPQLGLPGRSSDRRRLRAQRRGGGGDPRTSTGRRRASWPP